MVAKKNKMLTDIIILLPFLSKYQVSGSVNKLAVN